MRYNFMLIPQEQIVNTIFISPVTLKSSFDVALNKRNTGQGSVFCV